MARRSSSQQGKESPAGQVNELRSHSVFWNPGDGWKTTRTDSDASGDLSRRQRSNSAAFHSVKSAAFLTVELHLAVGLVAAIIRILITALALCAESLVLKGRSNNRMAAMIKAHPGLKPLEEVDSEMSDLIAQEQRRQACAPRPKPFVERGARGAASRRVRVDASHLPRRRRAAATASHAVHVHRAHRFGELCQ